MKTMTYTESWARYAEVLDGVTDDREPVVITRAGHEPVVIVSLDDYESLRETAHLMRSPANSRRLLDAMERLKAGRGPSLDVLAAVYDDLVSDRFGEQVRLEQERIDWTWVLDRLPYEVDGR